MTYDYDFEAGTDHPLYVDDNVVMECRWNESDAIPFGYWIGGSGESFRIYAERQAGKCIRFGSCVLH